MAENLSESKKSNDDFLKPVKFVRDLVLGYVYLTKFDIKIIDTLEFQRLKDIRQLTCQQVFPSARHTRFEHSLGVMELTRQALDNLNINGFIFGGPADNNISSDKNNYKEKIFNEHMRFNAAMAALLHDVGHCPFSHLGEAEMSAEDVWKKLYKSVMGCKDLEESSLRTEFIKQGKKTPTKGFGAKHEQLSCIVILEKTLRDLLSSVGTDNETFDDGSPKKVDFELLIRSIMGMEYDVSTSKNFEDNKKKNVIVKLINSRIFDLDKLDYVMRDSWFTGIGAPQIDIHRLFRNMYLNNNSYELVFTNRAVPALQNLIESRDELYMYVYNHHTSVFSDFMFSYIFRRLTHNERDFNKAINPSGETLTLDAAEEKSVEGDNKIFNMGIVPSNYLFSPEAILYHKRSDSNFVSLLNNIGDNLSTQKNGDVLNNIMSFAGDLQEPTDEINKLAEKIRRTQKLVEKYQKRTYLKPWWKTSSEFNNFIKTNFIDDPIREKLCKWICHNDSDLKCDEFRSQLAKNVSYITRRLKSESVKCELIEQLNNDEFFVIQRSSHFFDPETIGKLEIALKSNEMLGSPKDVKYCSGNYYIKSLTNVIPQRDYYSMYAENSFYIFSKQLDEKSDLGENDNDQRVRHYHFIEQIFVFVATKLINDGIRKFNENYGNDDTSAEETAHNQMYDDFKKSQGI